MKTLNKILLTTTPCIAVAPTVAILTSCHSDDQTEFQLTVTGATYDEKVTKLELNKESTIVLIPNEGKEISNIISVKVGDTTLGSDLYSYDPSNYRLTITAQAMKSKTITVAVQNFEITVSGADYDIEWSKLVLNQDSAILLVPAEGKQVTSITSVKVGDTTLVEGQYYFSKTLQTVVIYEKYMTSYKISIVADTSAVNIAWKDGWYAYNKHTKGGCIYSDFINAEFELAEELGANQTLEFEIEETETTTGVQLAHETLTVSGKTVTIPLRLKTNYSYIEFGSHSYYTIKFTCKDSTSDTVWQTEITDCFIFLLFALQAPTAWTGSHVAGSGEADLETRTTINVPTKKWDDEELELKTEIVETTSRPVGSTADVTVMYGQAHPYKSEGLLYQAIKISDTTGLKAGDVFEFTVRFTVTLTLFPTKPISFEFKNVKFQYI